MLLLSQSIKNFSKKKIPNTKNQIRIVSQIRVSKTVFLIHMRLLIRKFRKRLNYFKKHKTVAIYALQAGFKRNLACLMVSNENVTLWIMRQYDRFFIRDSESFNDFGSLAPQLPSVNCNYVPALGGASRQYQGNFNR